MKIIDTDNFGGDYPDERFLNLPSMPTDVAIAIVKIINANLSGPTHPRCWMVVGDDYTLSPGFEP